MTEIIVDASNVDQDKLFWLKKGNNGKYYIQHRMNRQDAHDRNIPVTDTQARDIENANDDFMAWCEMDRIYGESI